MPIWDVFQTCPLLGGLTATGAGFVNVKGFIFFGRISTRPVRNQFRPIACNLLLVLQY
jgi:hypothetical protein